MVSFSTPSSVRDFRRRFALEKLVSNAFSTFLTECYNRFEYFESVDEGWAKTLVFSLLSVQARHKIFHITVFASF